MSKKKKKGSGVFSEGDVVKLNIEGTPTMIVHGVEGVEITCDWFDGKSLCRKSFHEKELVSATPSASNREVARAVLSILQEAKASGSDASPVNEDLTRIGEILEKNTKQ